MPPHAVMMMDIHEFPSMDSVEIEHVRGKLCNVRYLKTDTRDDISSPRYVRDGTAEIDSESEDSVGQLTFYDSIASFCSLDCTRPHPRKSALKKQGTMIRPSRSVSFDSLTVREYDLTLGDHPSSASGPPVQLNWDHKQEKTVNLEDYESRRQPRRKRRQLKMSFQEREEILFSSGFTMDQLKNAWMESLKIRQQRYETLMTGSISTKVEEAWESACRKFNRFWSLSSDEEGFEVKAESKSNPSQWSYVSSDNGSPSCSCAEVATWSMFSEKPSSKKWTVFANPHTKRTAAI